MSDTERIPEYFVSALDHVEVMGSVARYVLVSYETREGRCVAVSRVHIIMPNSAVPDAIDKTVRAASPDVISSAREMVNSARHH